MSLTRAQRLNIAVGKALEIGEGFSKYLKLLAKLGPNDSPTQEMTTIAEATNAAAKSLFESDPELMAEILPPELFAELKTSSEVKNSSTDSLQFPSVNEANDVPIEVGGFQTANMSQQKKERVSTNVVQYVSRWISKYQSDHFDTMKQILDSCNNSFLKSYYNTIAFAIERRFAIVFASKEKTREKSVGKIEIISTVMPVEVFQLWCSFQYFSSSSAPFERTWNLNSNFSTWTHSMNLNSLSVPVFQTKDYFKWEYQLHNGTTKQTEYYRMYTYKIDLEYEFESQLFTITAHIRKEKYSITNRRWQIRE